MKDGACVPSRGNKSTEGRFLAALERAGGRLSHRLHATDLPGTPDAVVYDREGSFAAAVFLDGCFWHHCWRCKGRPKRLRKAWLAKLLANVSRDRHATEALLGMGYAVFRFWEHDLVDADACVAKLLREVR